MALLNCFAELVQNKFHLDCICLFEVGGEKVGGGQKQSSLQIEGRRMGIKHSLGSFYPL